MPPATDRDASSPTVSVVIAAYNAESFIERAIRSALDQTHAVAEVIVIDDASTDATVAIVMRISDEDDRVKLLSLPTNGGPAKARNAGFATALGDWLAVLDADDAYVPDRLSHLMSKSGEADILADNFLFYDPATNSISGDTGDGWELVDLPSFADARRDHSDFGLFKPVFRRSFIEEHELGYPEDVRHGEDFILAFEAIARGARYWLAWRSGYLYTARKSGWSRTLVDYGAMATHLDALLNREDLSPDVCDKVRDRVAYTRDLDLNYRLRTAFEDRRILTIMSLAIQHPKLLPLAANRAFRFVRS